MNDPRRGVRRTRSVGKRKHRISGISGALPGHFLPDTLIGDGPLSTLSRSRLALHRVVLPVRHGIDWRGPLPSG